MIAATTIAAGLLAMGAVGAIVRLARGPSLADRMVALDALFFTGIGGLAVFIVRTRDATYVPVFVVVVLIAFLGTVVVARYIEEETDRS